MVWRLTQTTTRSVGWPPPKKKITRKVRDKNKLIIRPYCSDLRLKIKINIIQIKTLRCMH